MSTLPEGYHWGSGLVSRPCAVAPHKSESMLCQDWEDVRDAFGLGHCECTCHHRADDAHS